MKTKAEVGMMWPQANEHPDPLATGGGNKGSSPEALGGAWPRGHLDFGLLASRAEREPISVIPSHGLCDDLSQQSLGNSHPGCPDVGA